MLLVFAPLHVVCARKHFYEKAKLFGFNVLQDSMELKRMSVFLSLFELWRIKAKDIIQKN